MTLFSTRFSFVLATFLLMTTVTYSQLGDGWKSQTLTKKVHLDDVAGLQIFNWTPYKSVCTPEMCADYTYESDTDTETFRIFDSRSNRSEIRLQNDYSTGSRQFEGYVTIYPPLNDESLMQIFGSTSGATQMMLRGYAADGGSIRGAGKTVATNIYGKEVRVNVIHLQEDMGNKIQIYIDGVKMAEIADNEPVSNYHKYGCYGTTNGNVPAVVKWRQARFFRDGTAPGQSITAAITSPANGSSFSDPANITINAAATDAQNSVEKVEFFAGSVKIGEDLSSPYSIAWNNVAVGSYSLQTRATSSTGEVAISAPVSITVTGITNSFDITDNGGGISAQYTNTSKPTENFPSLIDNKSSTKYYISNRKALWVQYQSTVPAIVVKYTITSANDVIERDPKDWSLLGSNDGVSWVTLDTRSNEEFPTRFLKKTYTFSNTIPYTYYRLNITSNNGHAGTQFAEWELFERRTQTITMDDISDKTFGDPPFELTATASSGLQPVFELVSGPAELTGNTLSITGAGEIVVRSLQSGNENYFAAEPVVKTIVVNKAEQRLAFVAIEPKTFGDAPFELEVTTDTDIPVIFEVISGPASVSEALLTITGAGEVTVRATQAGNENYQQAVAELNFTVNKALQTITFPDIMPAHFMNILDLNASASSGLPVEFSVVSGPAFVTGNTVSFSDDDIVVVQASQPGNENYHAAAPVEQQILVYGDDSKEDRVKLVIHPNPTYGSLKVKFDNKKDKQYAFAIYDDHGNVITSTVIPISHKKFEIDFDITDSYDGIYYLWASDGIAVTIRRIIKE